MHVENSMPSLVLLFVIVTLGTLALFFKQSLAVRMIVIALLGILAAVSAVELFTSHRVVLEKGYQRFDARSVDDLPEGFLVAVDIVQGVNRGIFVQYSGIVAVLLVLAIFPVFDAARKRSTQKSEI
jgi:hypothetical protein